MAWYEDRRRCGPGNTGTECGYTRGSEACNQLVTEPSMMEGGTAGYAGPRTDVLFVCMGNICRSPTAEGVFRKLHKELAPQLKLHIASAGTHACHVDEPPDERAVLAAHERNIDISAHRGRVVTLDDFYRFDYILAMDRANLSGCSRRPAAGRADMRLLLEFAEGCAIKEVPDPYYGGPWVSASPEPDAAGRYWPAYLPLP